MFKVLLSSENLDFMINDLKVQNVCSVNMYATFSNYVIHRGPSIKDVGIFFGGGGVSNFDVARY